jgi:hypothetical protein
MQYTAERRNADILDISYSHKKSGIQSGLVCLLNYEGERLKYFVKTRQHGPTDESFNSASPPDLKELFIYKLLYRIGVGTEPHFIIALHGTKIRFTLLRKIVQLLSHLTNETASTVGVSREIKLAVLRESHLKP